MRSVVPVVLLCFLVAHGRAGEELSAEQTAFFEKNIRPLLIKRCYECHSVEAGKSKGGLSLDSRESTLKGGDTGPALVAGKPDDSLIIHAVRYQNQDTQMPPKGALPPAEVHLLEDWVKMGAPDPREATTVVKAGTPRVIDIEEGAKHWAFRPVRTVKVPGGESGNPIDGFVDEKLRESGLSMAPQAEPRVLIRRMTFDLTGLPPTPEEVDAFVDDAGKDQAGAIRRLIDRLLASPHYGEKWGRHWLDVARYADSNGLDENIALGTAWRYRDYVVDAFNDDLPFDQFITEQLAGDLLESKDVPTRQRRMAATAFLNLGAKVLAEPDKEKLVMDVVDEQIDVVGRAFMGLTLGCARCHDHKFDPIGQDDYYALAAIFKSTKSLSSDRIGALSTAFESPMGDFEAFAEIKSAERILGVKKAAVTKAESAANKKLSDEARAKAVDYLVAAGELPPTPTMSQVKPVAAKHGVRPEILLNCRVWLAANESHPVFKTWREGVRRKGDASGVRGYYKFLFAGAARIKPPEGKVKPSDSIVVQARAALHDAKGFLALPPEPMILYTKEEADELQGLRDAMMATQSELPDLPTAISVCDGSEILEGLPIHIRGSHLSLGKMVPRAFPKVIQVAMKARSPFRPDQSGRLELARWLSSPAHPLSTRVWVNRVWTWHFNQGIVPTPDNFGLLGGAPTHPELLDWLARWFVTNGQSVKSLHRLILTSKTYQQGSGIREPATAVDPENLLLHRFPVRRLEAEEVRDALLHVAGSLDPSMGGKTIPRRNREFVFNHTSKDLTTYDSSRRALYLPIIRNNLYDLFQQFDYPDPATSTGARNSTVVSPQALVLMNSELATRAARSFGARVVNFGGENVTERLRAAWRLAFAREPNEGEIRRARDFLTTVDAALASDISTPVEREERSWQLLAQSLFMSSEFIYVR